MGKKVEKGGGAEMTSSEGVRAPTEERKQSNNTKLVFKDSYTRKIKLTDVIFENKIYPRAQYDTSLISKYRDAIDQLPPIVIDKKNRLIDGYHRLMAYSLEGKEEIEVTIFDSEDDRKCLIESIKLNATHGKQLSQTEKKDLGRNLYLQGIEDAEISKTLSISDRTLRNYVRDLKEEQLSKRDAGIKEMWLNGVPIRRISEIVGLSKSRVDEIVSGFGKVAETGQPTVPQTSLNFWENPEDPIKDRPRKLPVWVLENLLHMFTSPHDLILEYGSKEIVSNLNIACHSIERRYLNGTEFNVEEMPSLTLVDVPLSKDNNNNEEIVKNVKKSLEDIATKTEMIESGDYRQPVIAFTCSIDDWFVFDYESEFEGIKTLGDHSFRHIGDVNIVHEIESSTLEKLKPKAIENNEVFNVLQRIWLYCRNGENWVANRFREAYEIALEEDKKRRPAYYEWSEAYRNNYGEGKVMP